MRRAFLAFLFSFIAFALCGCSDQEPSSGIFSFTGILGGQHTLADRDRIIGDVYVFSGEFAVESGAGVRGSLLVLGGEATVAGEVEGDVSLLGGRLTLAPTAWVGGQVTVAAGRLDRSPLAVVKGGVKAAEAAPEPVDPRSRAIRWALDAALPALLVSVMAYLLARYLPAPLGRVTDAIVRHPLVSLAMGVLAGCVGLVLIVLVAFTVILIPFSLAGGAALLLAVAYGWAGGGLAVGRLLTGRLSQRLSAPIATFLGTLLFMSALGLLQSVPIISGIVPLLAAATALGAVILTRFGWVRFIPATDDAPDSLPDHLRA